MIPPGPVPSLMNLFFFIQYDADIKFLFDHKSLPFMNSRIKPVETFHPLFGDRSRNMLNLVPENCNYESALLLLA